MFSAAPPSARPQVFRRTGPVVFWWIWLAFALFNVVDLAIQGPGHFAVVVTAILVAVTGVVYACALRPRVIASDAGLAVKNPVRDHRIPWGAVEAVDVGDWVRVHCAPRAGPSTAGRCSRPPGTGASPGAPPRPGRSRPARRSPTRPGASWR